jgi:hypothetical protein
MTTLPPIHGILREIAAKQKRAGQFAFDAAGTDVVPMDAGRYASEAKHLEAEAAELEQIAQADAEMIAQISILQNYLAASPKQSALRTLALRDLQSAEAWLRREIGDPSEN